MPEECSQRSVVRGVQSEEVEPEQEAPTAPPANALAASNKVLIPLQCEFYALEGLSQILRVIKNVKSQLNESLDLDGILLTMYDSRNKLSFQVEEDVREVMGSAVYETIIPRNIKISEAPSHGKPILLYDHSCVGSEAYVNLAAEVLKKGNFGGL